MSMVKIRQNVEREIAQLTIKTLLAAGYQLAIYDGEEVHPKTRRAHKALEAMMQTDEDYILVFVPDQPKRHIGWVRFVYGNDGWDVINNYTTNLERVLAPVTAYCDSLQ